jgi:hypothetical protein
VTAVTLRPTFKKDSRTSNGLEDIADELLADKTKVHYVVGAVKWAGGSISEEGDLLPAAKFLAIEPLAEGSSPEGLAKKILDEARKARGLGRMEDEHPATSALFDFDGDGKPVVRVGADGEHPVPEPSGEEIVAELDERRAAKGRKATADPFTPGDTNG